MIIEKFIEQVEAFPTKIAVKTGNRTITYSELSAYANQVAHAITKGDRDREETGGSRYQAVSLFFEHGADMIIGVLGALMAGKTYVPLDITYPSKRLLYMLEHSDSYLLLTNRGNLQTAAQLAARTPGKPGILNINTIVDADATGSALLNPDQNSPAYILYTSGSTGRPKGVVQTHRNLMYYTKQWIKRFSITESDRLTFITSFSHDQSVQDIFAALLSGATLYPYYMKSADSSNELYTLLMKEKITIWHSVPTLFQYFANTLTEKNVFYDTRWLVLGGEPMRPNDFELFKTHFPNSTLAMIYGQTESSVNTICTVGQTGTFDTVCLGEPLDETETLLVGEDGETIETMGVGEIVVASDYIAPGY
ncbi:MAG: amino acid adenylation domain-containing protein, partial [bacterium]|nr:amino acid adenylation domain-containing protein [bacterium]